MTNFTLTAHEASDAMTQSTSTRINSPAAIEPFLLMSWRANIFSLKVIPRRPDGRRESRTGGDFALSIEFKDSSQADTKKRISDSWSSFVVTDSVSPRPPSSGGWPHIMATSERALHSRGWSFLRSFIKIDSCFRNPAVLVRICSVASQ